jgi:hypothetical protein
MSGCPKIYETSRNTVIVQGYVVANPPAGAAPPDGELMVEIPVDLLAEAARALQ